MKHQLLKYDPLNPPKVHFKTMLTKQVAERLTSLHHLAEGWEGS